MKQTENYIVLKPIAERFSKVASEMTDSDIETIIKDVMKERIADVIDFSSITDKISEFVENHEEIIVHAVLDSIAKRLELPSNYKFY